jgi:hypothetical protein
MTSRVCSSGTFERFVKRPLTQFVKVAGVPKEVARDAKAQALHPETEWVGALRRSNALSDAEQAFLHARLSRLTGSRRNGGLLASYMKLEDLDEEVLLEDIPVIGLGGSGGGMRANLGFGAVMEAMQADGLWALLAYVAGVSGSCWALAAFYTWGACDFGRVMDQFETSANHHPLSRTAVQRVADAPGGGALSAYMHVRGAKHEYSVPAVGPHLPQDAKRRPPHAARPLRHFHDLIHVVARQAHGRYRLRRCHARRARAQARVVSLEPRLEVRWDRERAGAAADSHGRPTRGESSRIARPAGPS